MKSQNAGGQKTRMHFIVLATFAIVACVLIGVVLYRNYFVGDESVQIVRSRIVVPVSNEGILSGGEGASVISESAEATSFITLSANETLLSSITFDFDGDNFDDQVIAVRKSERPYIYLLVAIYVPSTNAYVRAAELETGISRTRGFSYAGMDMTGSHRTALVYQGIRDDNTSAMRIYHCDGNGNHAEMVSIGDFSSDGTIFIQQSVRSASYELSQSSGNSFSVWVYSSGTGEIAADGKTSVAQIQTEYAWSEDAGRYVQVGRRRVAGAALAAEERARILDGTIETFVRFLQGLWYKTSNEGESMRFLYFDYDTREIIFLYRDAQEVYTWEDSSVNRTGIYLTSSNAEIATMQRRFDITLSSGDTVQMHIIDDVRSLIREAAVWDGEYRKMSSMSLISSGAEGSMANEIKKVLESYDRWLVNSVDSVSFSGGAYDFQFNGIENIGAYSIFAVAGVPVIQFRQLGVDESVRNSSRFFGAYKMSFGKTEIPAQGRTPARIEENRDEIIFTPVLLSPNGTSAIEGDTIILTHVIEDNESN